MSPKLKKSSKAKRKTTKRSQTSFDPAILRQAKKLVANYRLILEQPDHLGYVGSAVEMPSVFAQGKTAEACIKATRSTLTIAAATMLECEQKPPAPASAEKRDVRVKIRLSANERLQIAEIARRMGYRGVSDYIRALALGRMKKA